MQALVPAPRNPRARDLFLKTIDLLSMHGARCVSLAVAFLALSSIAVLFTSVAESERTGTTASVSAAVVAVVLYLMTSVIGFAMCRKFIGASYGLDIDNKTLLTDTAKRLPHVLAWTIGLVAFFGVLFVGPVLLIIYSSWFVILLLPFLFGVVFASTSYLMVGNNLIIAGPKKDLPNLIRAETKGRWWLIFRMGLITNLTFYLVALVTSPIALLGSVGGTFGSVVASSLLATLHVLVAAAGTAAIHHHLKLPTGAELLPEGFDPSTMTMPYSDDGPPPPPPPPGGPNLSPSHQPPPPPPARPNTPPPPQRDTPW